MNALGDKMFFERNPFDAIRGRTDLTGLQKIRELLPLLDFWMVPSIYPATQAGLRHKFGFVMAVFNKKGLPIYNDEIIVMTEQHPAEIAQR